MAQEKRTISEPDRPLWASADDMREAAEGWSDIYLDCRDGRHKFEPHTAARDKNSGTIDRVKKCQCGARRIDTISARTGELTKEAHIDYSGAPGYLLKGVGRMAGESRDIVRLLATERTFPNISDLAPRRAKKAATKKAAAPAAEVKKHA